MLAYKNVPYQLMNNTIKCTEVVVTCDSNLLSRISDVKRYIDNTLMVMPKHHTC